MRKKLLAILLAAVMVMALLPTAFAAAENGIPRITINVKDPDALRIEGTTFRLREWNVEFNEDPKEGDWGQLLTKGDSADYTSEELDAHELPLGVTLTVEMADPSGQGFTNGSNVSVAAWSDPDGDGVYNCRVYAETWGETPTAGLLPASEEGPFKVYMSLMGGFFFANEDGIVNGDGYSGIEYAPSFSWSLPTTFQITSDYLTEFYGAHTLVKISILIDRDTWAYDEYYFLLTGEQAGPETDKPAEPELPTKFTDVPAGAYYAAAVSWAVENKYTVGTSDTEFSPDKTCTHIQILTFLWRAAGRPSAPQSPVPKDPGDHEDYHHAIDWAYSKGMINTDFKQGADCTRADTVKYLWQADGSKTGSPVRGFIDVDAGADYFEAVNWAAANGITAGDDSPTTFNPTGTCTRGQIVTFLHRVHVPSARVYN